MESWIENVLSADSAEARAERAFFALRERPAKGRREDEREVLAAMDKAARTCLDGILNNFRVLQKQDGSLVELKSGSRLGDYKVLEKIGQGSMGTVYLAVQYPVGREVALKVLHDHLFQSERAVERFLREAQAAGRVRHASVVTVFAAGQHEERLFIAQELVGSGRSLVNWIAERAAASELPSSDGQRVARLFAALAEGLHAAHEENLVHRDVKPANVVLNDDDQPKLADFGLARILDEGALTESGESAGTLLYQAPEQVDKKHGAIDRRTDVFALGACLYEALTFQAPFHGDSVPQVTNNILHKEPADPRSLRSRVPRPLALIALKALEKSQRRRYASARLMGADLLRFLAGEPVLARPPGRLLLAQRWVRQHRVLASTMTLLLLAVGATTWQLRHDRALRLEVEDASERALQALQVTTELLVSLDPRRRAMGLDEVTADLAPAVDLAVAYRLHAPDLAARLYLGAGSMAHSLGHLDLALELVDHAQDLSLIFGKEERNLMFDVLFERARLLEDRWELEAAAAAFGELLLLAEDHDLREDPRFAQALGNFYLVLSHADDQDQVESLLAENGSVGRLLELAEKSAKERSADPITWLALLLVRSRVAYIQEQPTLARELADVALREARARLGESHIITLQALDARGTAYYREGTQGLRDASSLLDLQRLAERDFSELFGLAEATLGSDHPLTVRAKERLGVTLIEQGRWADAEVIYREVVPKIERIHGPDALPTLRAKTAFGVLYMRSGKSAEAKELLSAMLEAKRRILGPRHWSTLTSLVGLIEVHQSRGETQRHLELLRELHSAYVHGKGEFSKLGLYSLNELWRAEMVAGNFDVAEVLARRYLGFVLQADWDLTPGCHYTAEYQVILVLIMGGKLARADTELASLEARLTDESAPLFHERRFQLLSLRALHAHKAGDYSATRAVFRAMDTLFQEHPELDGQVNNVIHAMQRARIEMADGLPGRAIGILEECLRFEENRVVTFLHSIQPLQELLEEYRALVDADQSRKR